jgi:hypothetical protein
MSARRSLGHALAWLALGAAGCGGGRGVPDEDLEGLVRSPPAGPAAVEPARAAAEPAELARALAIRHRDVAAALGAHQVTVTSRYEVKEGGQVVEALADETTLAIDGAGHWRAVYHNDADYGREVIWHEDALYLRPRYARWHRRAANDVHEPLILREQIYAVLGDYYEVVAHAAELSDRGATRAAGRDGHRVEVRLAAAPGRPPPQHLVQRAWRATVTVQALDGEAVLDAETAVPLAARVLATYQFVRDGRTFVTTLEVRHEVNPEPPAAIEPPAAEEVVATPERSRDVDERDRLLKGMAPPARRAGGEPVRIPDERAGR